MDNRSNLPVIDEQENLGNSDDEDDQAQMPVDDAQTECTEKSRVFYFITFDLFS
jgi:hypothetical protein